MIEKKINKVPKSIWKNPIHFIACGFGVGAIPYAPGTFGTLLAIPLYFLLTLLSLPFYILITFFLVLIGIPLCDITNRDFGVDDHPAAVWDEFASFPIVMIGVPSTWYYLLLGFLLFRFFDILKPGVIGWLDRNIHGGLGAMLDDVVAALFSLMILQIVIHL